LLCVFGKRYLFFCFLFLVRWYRASLRFPPDSPLSSLVFQSARAITVSRFCLRCLNRLPLSIADFVSVCLDIPASSWHMERLLSVLLELRRTLRIFSVFVHEILVLRVVFAYQSIFLSASSFPQSSFFSFVLALQNLRGFPPPPPVFVSNYYQVGCPFWRVVLYPNLLFRLFFCARLTFSSFIFSLPLLWGG